MATPPLSREAAQAAYELIKSLVHEGFLLNAKPSAFEEAGRRTNIPVKTIRNRYQAYLDRYAEPVRERPDKREDQFSSYVSIHATARVRVRLKHLRSDVPTTTGPITRVIYATDTHDSPDLDKDRFRWIGQHVAERAPDYFIHGGDFADFDAFSRHEEWGTQTGNERQPFVREMDSLREALDELCEPLQSFKGRRLITLGNHDMRAWLWENAHPEMQGSVWSIVEDAFADRDFVTYPYREWLMVDGVGFTHAPHNAAGRPYGGKHPENQIATDATFSVVYGHTHKSVYRTVPKLGPANRLTLFNPGCALPHGYIKPYAQMGMSGWTWGIGEIAIQEGHIISMSMISMQELQDRYGK